MTFPTGGTIRIVGGGIGDGVNIGGDARAGGMVELANGNIVNFYSTTLTDFGASPINETSGTFFQISDPTGATVVGETTVRSFSQEEFTFARPVAEDIALLTTGDFALLSEVGTSGLQVDVYNSDGTLDTGGIAVPTSSREFGAITHTDDGGFAVLSMGGTNPPAANDPADVTVFDAAFSVSATFTANANDGNDVADIATLTNGNFATVVPDTTTTGGAEDAVEFDVDVHTDGGANVGDNGIGRSNGSPSVSAITALDDGGFAVVVQREPAGGTSAREIVFQVFNGDGTARSSLQTVEVTGVSAVQLAVIEDSEADEIIVFFTDFGNGTGNQTTQIFAASFDLSGNPLVCEQACKIDPVAG